MKKLSILFALVLILSSCVCTIGQVPPMYIYATEGCQGVLPNYIPMLIITDNCQVASVTQDPLPGYNLSGQEQTVTVVITAKDVFNNTSSTMFTVTLIDTVPPVIFYDTTIISQNYKMINSLYDAADKIVARQEMYFDNTFPYDILRVSYVDSLGVTNYITGIPDTIRPTNLYPNKIMLVWNAPGHALTGEKGRWITFQEPGDTLIVQ